MSMNCLCISDVQRCRPSLIFIQWGENEQSTEDVNAIHRFCIKKHIFALLRLMYGNCDDQMN